ncbi:MAG: GPH family glycoside/pentoside/hexuronide:cation symporter, partial [Gammaproteobacteria bacterium]
GNQTEDTIFLLRLFDVTIPLLTSILALWAISKYTITEERAQEIRIELENRRQ